MRKFLVFAAVMCLLGSGQTLAQNAYITNQFSNSVSVIETATNTVIATIPVGGYPVGVAVTTAIGIPVFVRHSGSLPRPAREIASFPWLWLPS